MTPDFNQIVLTLGLVPVSLGTIFVIAAGLAVLLLALLYLSSLLKARRQARVALEMDARFQDVIKLQNEMTGRLQTVADIAVTRQTEISRTLNERLDRVTHSVGQNLSANTEKTSESLAKINERLAVIDTAQKNLADLSGQMVSLQDILANKQARGAFGQGRMETIIRDGLPKHAYEFQPTLSNGTRPDCVIRLPNVPAGIVVDAKFPLEAFRDLPVEGAGTKQQTQRVRQDITKHIRDIADKYLIAGETQDMALMFVPSEAIYAQLHDHFEDVIAKAYKARIVIVSPNMLMLAVHTMQAILKDARMREQANLIQIEVGAMMADVHRLTERVLDLQKHFGLVDKDIEKILISADKISRRGLRIDAVDLPEDQDSGEAGEPGEAGELGEPADEAPDNRKLLAGE
jgi:DNA recombination protein RmuC